MYKAIKRIQRIKPKKDLLIETKDGITTNENTQVKLKTEFFENYLNDKEVTEFLNATPRPMNTPFTTEEIAKAIKKLKDNKAAGSDNVSAEQLKY